jgi:hypothetical protein
VKIKPQPQSLNDEGAPPEEDDFSVSVRRESSERPPFLVKLVGLPTADPFKTHIKSELPNADKFLHHCKFISFLYLHFSIFRFYHALISLLLISFRVKIFPNALEDLFRWGVQRKTTLSNLHFGR